MGALYDVIGVDYDRLRRPDPRIAAQIGAALDGMGSVLNVGAGAGSYEPCDRRVLAVEPARTMIAQRPPAAAPVVQASAIALPVRDGAFDAALAVLTVHHWPDQARGVRELARVARRRVVILTWTPDGPPFWLIDYLPEILVADLDIFPTLDWYERVLGPVTVTPVPIAHDCADGFLCAYWRRPAAYLDPAVRGAISSFAKLADPGAGLARLKRDLDSGAWQDRYGPLLEQTNVDLGYRLVVAERHAL